MPIQKLWTSINLLFNDQEFCINWKRKRDSYVMTSRWKVTRMFPIVSYGDGGSTTWFKTEIPNVVCMHHWQLAFSVPSFIIWLAPLPQSCAVSTSPTGSSSEFYCMDSILHGLVQLFLRFPRTMFIGTATVGYAQFAQLQSWASRRPCPPSYCSVGCCALLWKCNRELFLEASTPSARSVSHGLRHGKDHPAFRLPAQSRRSTAQSGSRAGVLVPSCFTQFISDRIRKRKRQMGRLWDIRENPEVPAHRIRLCVGHWFCTGSGGRWARQPTLSYAWTRLRVSRAVRRVSGVWRDCPWREVLLVPVVWWPRRWPPASTTATAGVEALAGATWAPTRGWGKDWLTRDSSYFCVSTRPPAHRYVQSNKN